ncbi:MAG: hypothetical protein MI919_15960 [Holophagales bacterium]|nr:hypothetical protein [Holophagales bacterium]
MSTPEDRDGETHAPKPSPPRAALTRAHDAIDISERIEAEQIQRKRSEALAMGRAMALVGLPYRRPRERTLSREIRLGKDLRVSVTYSATDEAPLPYGQDRFVMAGIQHLAVERGSPFVSFEEAGELLRLFDLGRSGAEYRRLRDRLKRLRGLKVDIRTHSEEHPVENGWSSLMLNAHRLPTRRQVKDVKSGQLSIPGAHGPYYVKLSDDWWNYLQEGGRNLLLVRLDLLRQFIDRPAGWDYLCFLVHRCGSAGTESIVPHDVLVGLFKRGKEADRQTMARLARYHEEIMVATDGKLAATLEVIGEERGKGRPRQLWGLKVGPSDPLIATGRNVLETPPAKT